MAQEKPKKIRKLVNIPEEWLAIIAKNYPAPANTYIVLAIHEKMKKDGWIE